MGRVSNVATNTNLEGAMVRLEGTNFSARTERDGSFELSVPAGSYTLAVSYTGLDAQSVPISVQAGASVRRDIGLSAEIYKMSKYVVASEREGSALAITLQRQSLNVKNVISSDAFGTLANGNPGELIMRVPGVVGDSVGSDIRFVIIRGMGPQLNTVQVDGNRMANAGSAGATRDFQFQTVVADSIERLEVTKSPTPDMDADSIGGAVNMVTKNAFDRAPGRRISYSAGIIWRPFEDRDEKPGRRGYSFSYSEVLGEKKNIGLSFNYGMRETGSIQDTITQTPQQVDTDPAFISGVSPQDFRNIRTRWGGNVKLDYKLSEQTRFYSNVSMNKHFEHSNHTNFTYGTNTTVATRDAAGNLTGTGGIVPGYTSDRTEWR
ncbi:MAG: carboxypeptidase-like regulatory domain-containing protein, partial [Verrucomicrobia bacterium]|nr:carboxypeptidase-like regulatory domain-containing protein [Verrucomicrobiota bacterium]